MGVVLLEAKEGGYRYALVSPKYIEEHLEDINKRLKFFVEFSYWAKAWVFVVTNETWSLLSLKEPLIRQYSGNASHYTLSDPAAIDDLFADGRLLAQFEKID